MLPLSTWNPPARLVGLLTDIDDTLTTEGVVPAHVVQAMESLKARGLAVIPITGRPVGWSEPFAAAWPVDAIVAENGAVALQRSLDKRDALLKRYQQDAATRAAHFARMQQVLADIEARVPGARRATDSPGRETDIAIDHSEFTHNKLEGARWIVRELLGRDLDAEIDRWVYVGDSTNDQLMFEHFPHSVGVANIARFVPQLQHLPRYVTQGERGAGFAEVARAILAGLDRGGS